MKISKAIFRNFRLLRELELDFSTDQKKPLTVIRGANESGKTTILTALQWGFYGEAALPAKGKDFRLGPIDWDSENDPTVPIEVTIEFEHLMHTPKKDGGFRKSLKKYRLIRSTKEELHGKTYKRGSSDVALSELTKDGDSPIDPVEPELNDILPPELREVFFTDGDRALSFIEADTSTKRQRVQGAIKSLLGLGIIEAANKHVVTASDNINKKVKSISSSTDLSKCTARLEKINEELSELEPKLEDLDDQRARIDLGLKETGKEIDAALIRGNEDELRRELEDNRKRVQQFELTEKKFESEHANLFKDKSLGIVLLSNHVQTAFDLLSSMKERGAIPKNTIPVLQDRLEMGICICGESLAEDTPEGTTRRKYLDDLIEEQRDPDELRELLTSLYYDSKNYLQQSNNGESKWESQYKSILKERSDLSDQLEEAEKINRSLELKLDNLRDTNIQEHREKKRLYETKREDVVREHQTAKFRISNLNSEKQELENTRNTLLRKQEKHLGLICELEAISDIQNLLTSTYDTILSEELAKVSTTMNDYFMEMIVADPKQDNIIREATITSTFDIVVYGPDRRLLDPDRDLNGASRRALTLSFILALTRISEVVAPNIIDTPLGMTSGQVKRSILKNAIQNSSQLVLFLTSAEINNCEDIIDEYGGQILTITNSAHYPAMLKNDPKVSGHRILRCDCDHQHFCEICERVEDNPGRNLSPRSI